MYFRITIPSLQDGKKDEAISPTAKKLHLSSALQISKYALLIASFKYFCIPFAFANETLDSSTSFNSLTRVFVKSKNVLKGAAI